MLPTFWSFFFFFLSFWVEMLPWWLILKMQWVLITFKWSIYHLFANIAKKKKKSSLRPFCFSCQPVVLKGALRQLPASFGCHSHGEGHIGILGLRERTPRQTGLCYVSGLWAAKWPAFIQTQVYHSLWCGWDENWEEETSQSVSLISPVQVCQIAFFKKIALAIFPVPQALSEPTTPPIKR